MALGWAVVWALTVLADPAVVEPEWRSGLRVGAAAMAGLAGAVLVLAGRRRPGAAAHACVVVVAVLSAGLSTVALHGTQWGWYGIYVDSSFRTEMATRYAEHLGLVDYGYRGLPAYYPPAVGWLQGRLAAATPLEGWQAVKPVQVALAALVPLLAFALWRRVAPATTAAAAAVVAGLWAVQPQKPDEWLVIACLVPWWLLAVRDVRAPGVRRWSALQHGVVLGLLLLVHTYFFLPVAIATVLAVVGDLVCRAPSRLSLRRALAIGATGLLVSAPSWLGAVVARLRHPSDDLQMRYAVPGGNLPELPLPPADLAGLVSLLGLAWLVTAGGAWVRSGRVDPLAAGLGTLLAGAWLTMALGALAAQLGRGLLTFKVAELTTPLMLLCGVVGGVRVLERLARQAGPHRAAGRAVTGLAAAAAALALAGATLHFTDLWATGRPALIAQTTRYPDGTEPTGGRGAAAPSMPIFTRPSDPSADQVRSAWSRLRPGLSAEETVLVTSRVELLATTPVHPFIAYKSIYSHPNGEWEQRLALLRQVAACPDASCSARLLGDNTFDRVDGLVLEHADGVAGEDGELVLRLTVDSFPDRTRPLSVPFPERVFAGPQFDRRDVGRLAVIAVDHPGR